MSTFPRARASRPLPLSRWVLLLCWASATLAAGADPAQAPLAAPEEANPAAVVTNEAAPGPAAAAPAATASGATPSSPPSPSPMAASLAEKNRGAEAPTAVPPTEGDREDEATPQKTPGPVPAPRKPAELPLTGRVRIAQLHGEVDPAMAAFVRRTIEGTRPEELLVLDIETLGGRLDSALAIRDALLATDVRTLCWVHPRAISAGALITLACDVVAIAPGGTIGAATPVQQTPFGMADAEEKVVSFTRAEMASTARMQGRPPEVAEAMVDRDVVIPGLVEKDKLLTLDDVQALHWGIADFPAADEAALWKGINRDPPQLDRVRMGGAEHVARFLSHGVVAALLLGLGLLGIGFELFHPTSGVALLLGLASLTLFFFGHHMVDLAAWWELFLVGLGVAFILMELATPGTSVLGFIGLKLLLAGLVLSMLSFDHLPLEHAWDIGFVTRALATVLVALLATLGGLLWLVRMFPSTRMGERLILQTVLPTPLHTERGVPLSGFVGESGVVVTDLRPVGRIKVRGQQVEARLANGYLERGATVRVIAADEQRVVVREEKGPPGQEQVG